MLSPESNMDSQKTKEMKSESNLISSMTISQFRAMFKEEIKSLATKEDLSLIEDKVEDTNKKVDHLEKRIEYLEKKEKSQNIIISGVVNKSAKDEIIQEVGKIIFGNLKIQDQNAIMDVRKLSERNGKMLVWARMRNIEIVEEIFKRTKELKGTTVYIDRDLTIQEREMKKRLLNIKSKILMVDKSKRVTVRRNKIIVGEMIFNMKNGVLMYGEEDGLAVLNRMFNNKTLDINSNNYANLDA